MGILDSILSEDMATLTDPDFFGETVVYTPIGGTPMTVQAQVFREPILANGGERAAVKRVDVFVSSDASVGIPIKPTRNADVFALAWTLGDAPSTFIVTEVLTQDTGGWHLKLKGA